MKQYIFLLFLIPSIVYSQKYEKGKFYLSIGNTFNTYGLNEYQNILSSSSMFSYGNEWVTDITLDGDDDNDLGIDYFDEDDEKINRNNFNISGQFGFFIVNGFLGGIGLEYGSLSSNQINNDDYDFDGLDDEYSIKNRYISYAISPFLRYYIPFNNNAFFFGSSYTTGSINGLTDEEIDYTSFQDYENETELNPISTSRFTFNLGTSFYLTENITFESSLNYSLSNYTQEEEIFIGTSQNGTSLYNDVDRITYTNAFFIKMAASFHL